MADTSSENVLYGVRQIDMTNLESDGSADASASEYSIATPQRVGITAVYENGTRQILRGGDDIVAVIEEDDKLIGFDINLTLSELMPEIDETICGGTATAGSDKWESPTSSSEEAYPFTMTIWVQDYTESDSVSTADGFIKFTFPFCKGRRDSQELADQSFSTPSYVIRCRRNESNSEDIQPAMTYEAAAAIS